MPNFEFDFSVENRQSLVYAQPVIQDDDFGDFETANQEPIKTEFNEPISEEKPNLSEVKKTQDDRYSFG